MLSIIFASKFTYLCIPVLINCPFGVLLLPPLFWGSFRAARIVGYIDGQALTYKKKSIDEQALSRVLNVFSY